MDNPRTELPDSDSKRTDGAADGKAQPEDHDQGFRAQPPRRPACAPGPRPGQRPTTAIPGAVSHPEPPPPARRSPGGVPRGQGATGSLAPEKQGSLPRVLLVTDSMSWGGAERHVVDLAVALSSRGYEVLVACSAGGPLAQELHQAGIPVRVLGGRLVKRRLSLAYAWRLRRLLRVANCQLVHAHVHASEVAAALATLGLAIPLVVTEHTEGPWRGRIARRLSRWTWHRSSQVVVVSKPIWRNVVGRDRVPAERVSYVPPVPARLGFRQPPREKADMAVAPIVGFVGRLQPEKGVDVLLQAAPIVLAVVPQATFVIIGDGPLRPTLEEQARQLGLISRVCFLGFRADVPRILTQLSMLAIPSRSEGTPLVLLEAMCAGVPVVASAIGGIKDVLRQGKEGLLVPPDDPAALAGALCSLLLDPERTRSMGEAGRQRGGQFVFAEMVDAIEKTYGRALGARLAGRN
jgi:glycosyltransferase involved in cell wall biosynthesis